MRLIVVGDLHGCLDELHDLLGELSLAAGDVVTSVGDFVTKGPRTLECVELWRERGWQAVLGNNDLATLRVIRGEIAETKDEIATEARRLDERADLVAYLESLPRVLDFPEHDAAVVHGGVLPHNSFAGGVDESVLLTLRDVVPEGRRGWRAARASDPDAERRFWADVWDGDRFVVYGHTPRPEVATHRRALGIDTGCVYGGKLTAAIRSDDGEWTTRSVPARKAWATRGGGTSSSAPGPPRDD